MEKLSSVNRVGLIVDEEIHRLWNWYVTLKKGSDDYRLLLKSRIEEERRPELRAELFKLLGMECARLDDIVGHIAAFERATEEFPLDPFMWTSLAGAYSFLSYDLARSLVTIDKAVEIARMTGQFRRQVLHSKARLLKAARDFRGLELCILEIMQEPASLTTDVAKEDDFLCNLPAGVISEDVLKKYSEFMTK